MDFQALLDGDSQQSTRSRMFKAGIALMGLSCLLLLTVIAPALYNANASEATSLMSMPTSLRRPMASSVRAPMTIHNLPGAGPFKELALPLIEATSRCSRDVSMTAVKSVMETMSSADRAVVAKATAAAETKAEELLKAGQTAPMGFFDPVGITSVVSEGTLMFFREAEIKHGRVCMLATLGLLVGEQFHPLLGGDKFDGPASQLFPFVARGVPLESFWPFAFIQTLGAIAWLEFSTSVPTLTGTAFGGIGSIQSKKYAVAGIVDDTNTEALGIKAGRIPGDLGFDPLGLKPAIQLTHSTAIPIIAICIPLELPWLACGRIKLVDTAVHTIAAVRVSFATVVRGGKSSSMQTMMGLKGP